MSTMLEHCTSSLRQGGQIGMERQQLVICDEGGILFCQRLSLNKHVPGAKMRESG